MIATKNYISSREWRIDRPTFLQTGRFEWLKASKISDLLTLLKELLSICSRRLSIRIYSLQETLTSFLNCTLDASLQLNIRPEELLICLSTSKVYSIQMER